MNIRGNAGGVAANLIAQVIWVGLVTLPSVGLAFLFGTTDLGEILGSSVAVPSWMILTVAAFALSAGVFLRFYRRKSSVVRGQLDAMEGNLALMREREKVDPNARVIRSTRFGRWPSTNIVKPRTVFRQELDKAVLEERVEVQRIWNIKTLEDVHRLREVLEKYRGQPGHSIRAYFDLPDFALPELLIVDGRGASMSFPSNRNPHDLDSMIRFNRSDLIHVVRGYFDVLWDRAVRMLDAGDVTPQCNSLLVEAERRIRESTAQPDDQKPSAVSNGPP